MSDILTLMKPALKELMRELLNELVSEYFGSPLTPPKAKEKPALPYATSRSRVSPKLLTYDKRRKIVWLLMNTTYSKRTITNLYNIHETTIAARKLKAASIWNKALLEPREPVDIRIPKKYLKVPALTIEEVLENGM